MNLKRDDQNEPLPVQPPYLHVLSAMYQELQEALVQGQVPRVRPKELAQEGEYHLARPLLSWLEVTLTAREEVDPEIVTAGEPCRNDLKVLDS